MDSSRRRNRAGRWRTDVLNSSSLRLDQFSVTIATRSRRALTRPKVEVKIQEDFKALGVTRCAWSKSISANAKLSSISSATWLARRRRHGSVDDLLASRSDLGAPARSEGHGARGAVTASPARNGRRGSPLASARTS